MSKYSTKFKRWFWSDKVQYEIRSFGRTFGAIMVGEYLLQLSTVYQGDFSQAAITGLVVGILRSAWKAFWQVTAPDLVKTIGSSATSSISINTTKGLDSSKKKNYN